MKFMYNYLTFVSYVFQISDDDDSEVNYDMHLKSSTGEISVYIIQPELAESYDNCIKLRLPPEAPVVKQEHQEEEKKEAEKKVEKKEEKKEEVKPKKRVGR